MAKELKPTLSDILRPSVRGYSLHLFSKKELDNLEIINKKGKYYLHCLVSDVDRPAKPEEIVRQLYISRLIKEYKYPKNRIFVEKAVFLGPP